MPFKIFHIEENEPDRKVFEELFKCAATVCSVNSFSCNSTAINHLTSIQSTNQKLPDLIVTGSSTAGNHFPILDFLRSSPGYKNIPVVTLSSAATEADISNAFQKGVCSYLSKPVNRAKMQHIIELLL